MQEIKQCCKCLLIKSVGEFHWRNKKAGTLKAWCKTCVKEYDKIIQSKPDYNEQKRVKNNKRRRNNRQFIIEYLTKHHCIDCGEDRIPCLQFDHKDDVDKVNNVSCMMNNSLQKIIDEINKCDVRCANCHAIRTSKQFGWYYNIES